MSARPWTKVWESWWKSRSHDDLDGVAIAVGLRCLSVANGSPERGSLLTAAGQPKPLAALARETRFSAAEVETAIEALLACGTLERRPDGVLVFPNFLRYQETPDAARKRTVRRNVRGQSSGQSSGQSGAMSAQDGRGQRTEDRGQTADSRGETAEVLPLPQSREPSLAVQVLQAYQRTLAGQGVWVSPRRLTDRTRRAIDAASRRGPRRDARWWETYLAHVRDRWGWLDRGKRDLVWLCHEQQIEAFETGLWDRGSRQERPDEPLVVPESYQRIVDIRLAAIDAQRERERQEREGRG